MKFLIDAQLPRRVAQQLEAAGHDVVHTAALPAGNRTSDEDLITVAIRDNRIVLTKDRDFVVSFWLRRLPPKLLLISTGNIDNDALWRLLAANLPALDAAFAQHAFIELTRTTIVTHD